LNAFLSSQEETIFGDLLENLAININHSVFKGKKAEENKFKSVDLIFERDKKIYIVGIKSGPNWGNADQVSTMRKNLKEAKRILREEGNTLEMIGVNGCVYGKDNVPLKKHKIDSELDYIKLCGQNFWELVSGDKDLYKNLIKPLDLEVKKRDDLFKETYVKKINEMTKDLIDLFYTKNQLDWDKIVDYVSKAKE
jgi:site-specific DNA-methyltransferase (cytosine-N4-specific)